MAIIIWHCSNTSSITTCILQNLPHWGHRFRDTRPLLQRHIIIPIDPFSCVPCERMKGCCTMKCRLSVCVISGMFLCIDQRAKMCVCTVCPSCFFTHVFFLYLWHRLNCHSRTLAAGLRYLLPHLKKQQLRLRLWFLGFEVTARDHACYKWGNKLRLFGWNCSL